MKVSLQWRVTLLTAFVLVICSITLSVLAMLNAQRTLITAAYELIDITDTKNGIEIKKKDETNESNETNRVKDKTIQAGRTAPQEMKRAKQNFDMTTILFCLLLTVSGTGAVFFVSGKALKPVRNLSQQISKIDEYNLAERLPESASNDEVSHLTVSFNHALDRLEDAFERQKRFSASAAHELKTPLTTIKAGIQVLSIHGDSTLSDYKENARMTGISIDRLTQVINDLLMLASSNEDVDKQWETIYLDIMFETIFDELSPIYENREISYKIDCDNLSLYGNTALLYRAFYNLIENSYKYNCEGGNITIRGCATQESIIIDIEDTGVGIPSEHLPFIFDAFYRVDGSRSRKTAGSGLGLSIVKSIIERHNGTIKVSSEMKKGTKFCIQFSR